MLFLPVTSLLAVPLVVRLSSLTMNCRVMESNSSVVLGTAGVERKGTGRFLQYVTTP